MIHFLLLINRQGKLRLSKFYQAASGKERTRIVREVSNTVLRSPSKHCNVKDWKGKKIVFRRYASLYFILCVDEDDNELLALEIIHRYCVVLDAFFGSVCELDIVMGFVTCYEILDELMMAGEIQETSARKTLNCVMEAHEEERNEALATAMGISRTDVKADDGKSKKKKEGLSNDPSERQRQILQQMGI